MPHVLHPGPTRGLSGRSRNAVTPGEAFSEFRSPQHVRSRWHGPCWTRDRVHVQQVGGLMRVTFVCVTMTIAIVVATISASAQTKTIPGEAETITATVEAIDATTRTLTVKGPKGHFVPITVPTVDGAILRDQGGRHDHGALLRQHRPSPEAGRRTSRRHHLGRRHQGQWREPRGYGRHPANDHGHDRRHRQQPSRPSRSRARR